MRFIIRKNSETGKKMLDLHNRIIKANQQAHKLTVSLGAEAHRGEYFSIGGGILSLIFSKPQDPKIWKSYRDLKNEYMPKLNVKKGKEIQKKIDALPHIGAVELNEILGIDIDNPWNHPGFNVPAEGDYIGVISQDKWGHPQNEDLKEVTVSQFNQMFQEVIVSEDE